MADLSVLKGYRLGRWQKKIADLLLSGYRVRNPFTSLTGSTRRWNTRYGHPGWNLRFALIRAGYSFDVEFGIRGGPWGAHYSLLECDKDRYAEDVLAFATLDCTQLQEGY